MLGLETKMSPFKLKQLFSKMSDERKEYFRKTPLGHFVDIQVGRMPIYLVQFIISKYNSTEQTIELPNGKIFRVATKNVHLTLGLPMAKKSMIGRPKDKTERQCDEEIAKWAAQFNKKKCLYKVS